MTETLFYDQELGARKVHEQIYRAPGSIPTREYMEAEVARLERSLGGSRSEAIEALEDAVAALVVNDHRAESLRPAA